MCRDSLVEGLISLVKSRQVRDPQNETFFCFEAGMPGFNAMPDHTIYHTHKKINTPQEGCTSTSKSPG